jgi:hypothetical protein
MLAGDGIDPTVLPQPTFAFPELNQERKRAVPALRSTKQPISETSNNEGDSRCIFYLASRSASVVEKI